MSEFTPSRRPEEVVVALCLLAIWLILVLIGHLAGAWNGAVDPADEPGWAGAISGAGAIVHCVADGRQWARLVLLTLVLSGLVYALLTGEPQLTEPLQGGALVARLMILSLPAVAICLLLTRRASRWFRR